MDNLTSYMYQNSSMSWAAKLQNLYQTEDQTRDSFQPKTVGSNDQCNLYTSQIVDTFLTKRSTITKNHFLTTVVAKSIHHLSLELTKRPKSTKTSIANKYKHTVSCMKISIMVPKPLHSLARTHKTQGLSNMSLSKTKINHTGKNIQKSQGFSPLKSIETKAQRNQSQEQIYSPSQSIST